MRQRSINTRWLFALLAFIVALPGWCKVGINDKIDLAEITDIGRIRLYAEGEDIEILTDEGFDDDFVNRKFHTNSLFNNKAGLWYYEFFIEHYNTGYNGEEDSRVISKTIQVWIYDNKGSWTKIGDIDNNKEGNVSNYATDLALLEHTSDDNYRLYPTQTLLEKGISTFELRFTYECSRHRFGHAKDKQYTMKVTKDVKHGLQFTYTPMPSAKFSVTTTGNPHIEANNVPGGSRECYYSWYSRPSNSTEGNPTSANTRTFNLFDNNSGWSAKEDKSNISMTATADTLSPLYAHTIKYRGFMKGDKSDFWNPTSGWADGGSIPAYLYPINLQATAFDQWSNTVTISWEAEKNYYDAYTNQTLARSTKGDWFLYREGTSEPIQRFGSGTADNNLRYTDTPPSYDSIYTYRVVFIPTEMQGTDISWFEETLRPAIPVNTWRDVSSSLVQNRTYTDVIKLVWSYDIQDANAQYIVQRSQAGTGEWEDITQWKNVDITKKSYTFDDDAPQSACEIYDYRIAISTLGSIFYSDVAENCNLQSGTSITSIDATKGTEASVVVVTWKVNQQGTAETWFNIERRPITNGIVGDWVKVGEAHGTASEYTYTDERVEAGSYYEYRVIAYGLLCQDQVTKSDELTVIGYSQARGTITGHISFGTGTSVSGVRVNLIKSGTDSNDSGQQQFFSRYISGESGISEGALTWTPDSARYATKLNSDNPLTVQLWIAPVHGRGYQPVFAFSDELRVGLQAQDENSYRVLFLHGGVLNVGEVQASRYNHLTVVYDGTTWRFIINGDTEHAATVNESETWTVGDGKHSFRVGADVLGTFNGLVDDVRLWNRALTDKEIVTNYNRLLGGTENGLVLYWPMDEGIGDYTFDVSKQNGIFNNNHPTVGKNARPNTITPAALQLYGVTDGDGNYIITGIPFDAGGTNYKLLPDYGVHEFQPASRSLYISPSSLTANNVDFTDKSSFPMRGYVYYTGTNIPVKGIYFYVDGNLVTTGGQVAQTNEDGFYEISVPIGEHYIEAKQTGHNMVNEGRWPTTGTYDFQTSVQQNFSDSTLVNFCGRVAGGEIQEALPVGFGKASGANNNIGIGTIRLSLNNPNLSFNCEEGTSKDATTTRPFYPQQPETGDAIFSTTWAGANNQSKYIYIKTDSLTGEFSAMLPPLKYRVDSIYVAKNPDVKISELPEIDMTNPIAFSADTLGNAVVGYVQNGEASVNSYKYNKKMVSIWYAEPTLTITDNSDSLALGAFGERLIKDYSDAYGEVDSIAIYRKSSAGTLEYLYDYPVFNMQYPYSFEIKGYEKYVNYDSGTPVTDYLTMDGQVLTVNNELSDNQRIVVQDVPEEELKQGDVYELKANQLALDSLGCFTYQWKAGLPNPTYPYTRHLGITYTRHNRTYVYDAFDAYVFGSLPLGNNFVTKGPDQVLMVLRDPPGSNSSTSWTTGKVTTDIKKKITRGANLGGGVTVDFVCGANVIASEGIGLCLISQQMAKAVAGGGFDASFSYLNANSTTYTLTATETVSTSNNKEYVGANGDVYIGISTNLIIGDCKNVGLFREGADAPFEVKDTVSLCMDDSITTTFRYTQREIETKQIPEWEEIRTSLLIPVDSEADAKTYNNTGTDPVYVTWKDRSGSEWKEGIDYYMIMGTDTITTHNDTIQYITSQINLWKQTMKQNEMDKVSVIESTDPAQVKKMKNISFDSGSTYSYTNKADTTETNTHQIDWALNLKGNGKFNIQINNITSVGFVLNWNFHIGHKGSATFSDPDENYTNTAQFTYNFSDTNIGSDYSVNTYKSQKGWSDIFKVVAGQTYCPYEDEVKTKYFEPGRHTLSNATEPMQRPQIRITNGKQNPSTTAVMTDVPAGEAAIFTLQLSNDAETDMAMTYVLGVKDATNPDGLQFMVDGVRFNSGRSIVVPAGESITKTLEVRQTDLSILDYTGVTLTLASSCQNDVTSVNGVIMDKCTVEVHFKPSSSPVTLKSGSFVVNTENSGILDLTLTDFNRSFQNLKSMGVEYKAEGDMQWHTVQNYVFNKADSLSNDDIVVPSEGDVALKIDMSNNTSYPDRTYIFRAYTETPYGTENIRAYSDEVTVVKDMHRPTAIGTPQPSDGILHAGDDIVVEFNEDIVPGYVNASNVTVTAKVNSQPTTHEVSLHLSGDEPTAATASDFYMQGNSSVGLWMRYTHPGYLFTHCTGDNAFTLAIDESGHLAVQAGQINKSTKLTLPQDKWMYLAYSYNEETRGLDLIVQYDTQSDTVQAELGKGRTLQQVVYAADKRLFLGGHGLEADIHDLRIYGICRSALEMATEKYNSTNIYTRGLMAHWPMDEGQGTKARDLRNDAHPLLLTAPNWHIDATNYAATVDAAKEQHLDLNIATATTDNNESYVLEFWFKGEKDKTSVSGGFPAGANKTLFQSGTNANNTLRLFTNEAGRLTLEYGINRKAVAPDTFDITSGWHHFALNVMRGASASVAIDGQRTAVFAETEVPPFEGARLVLGAGYDRVGEKFQYKEYMTGAFDEVRFWKGLLKPEVVQAAMYQCVDTTEAAAKGLTVYYPMEVATEVAGVQTKVPSNADMAPGQLMPGVMEGAFDLEAFTLNAPPIRRAPEVQTVISNATVSDRKVFVQLQPVTLAEIEGTTLDITVSKIIDLNGNTSLPITWQAYVHQNTLSWAKDSVTCIKDYGDDASFQVELVNSGKATEYYTITGLPTWLTTDNVQGEIAPDSRQAISFDLSPTAAVGNYDVNLSLVGNNEIEEPLRLVVKVKGMAPDWAVVPDSCLEEQMNLVGQVLIDGIVNENTESRLGAFIGTMCVGVATPQKARGSYYVPMTIYGDANKHTGKVVTFKFWDASTGITYVGLNATTPVQFKQDGMVGSYSHPVVFTNTDEVEQRLDVASGWNWISTYVQPAADLSLTEILVADGFLQSDVLKSKTDISYYDGSGWNTGTLKTIEPTSMYKLYVHQPVNIVLKGSECVPSQTPVQLNPKWSWIGYLPQAALDINQALAGSGAVEGDYIKSKKEFAIYGPYGWEGNLKTLEPGKGYMFYSQAPTARTFRYPDVTAANRAPARVKAQAPDYYFTPVGSEVYPDNMSIVLKLLYREQPVDTFEVAAFIDGECRATAKAEDGIYYLMIQGEGSGQPIQLRTFYQGEEIVVDETQIFRGDTNIGLPWQPYTIDVAPAIATGIHIADNHQDGEVKYFLPNGIQVPESSLRKGQVYIRRDESGKITKYRK